MGGSSDSPWLAIISAIVTPAILILASGSLVASTLTRIARVVDRARLLMNHVEESHEAGDERALRAYAGWLVNYRNRADHAERALRFFYTAIVFFVGACLSIAADRVLRDNIAWLALVLTVIGAVCLLIGTASLVFETNIAVGGLRSEIDFTLTHPDERAALGPDPLGARATIRRLLLRKQPPEAG